jgi:lysozyme
MTRPVCQQAVDLIKNAEGCRLEAYLCSAGKPTIGYGHTGPDVTPGDVGDLTISLEEAEALLKSDLEKFSAGVWDLVTVPLSDNQHGALTSFAFNLGLGNLKASTLLKMVNARDFAGAALQFARWDKATVRGVKVVLPGLTKRRAAEAKLFSS